MLDYNDSQVKSMLRKILFTDNFDIFPIGNHHLKRHLVYKVNLINGEILIFKLFYKANRRSREIASLKLLENSNVKCPKIINYGLNEDGYEWMLINFIEGELFDNILNKLTEENKIKIFYQMGEELGKIHSYKTFDYYGEWDEKGKQNSNINNYYEYLMKSINYYIEAINNQILPDKQLLLDTINKIKENIDIFKIDIKPRLVHNDFDGRNILIKYTDNGYELSGIIDFEGSYPHNYEDNLTGLYYRYFLDNKSYEESFLNGYSKYLSLDKDFYKRLEYYLLLFVVSNCSWAYIQARDYYFENTFFLNKIYFN